MPKKKANNEFIDELKLKNPLITPLEVYNNYHSKIQCECQVCGNKWFATPAHLLNGRGCPICAKKRVASKRKHSTDEFTLKLKEISPDIELLEDYYDSKTKIRVHCRICDNTWSVVPSSLLHGTGCPKCNKRYRRNNKEFIEELKLINSHISVVGKYENAHKRITVRCNRCGCEWSTEPNALLKGSDCPVCSHSQTSVVEQVLLCSFKYLLGDDEVVNRDNLTIGKELDIYIPNLKLAIEFGAWYWHSSKLESDIEKERLCERLGIKLITIYEGCPEDVVKAGLRNVILYKNVISREKDYLSIRGFLIDICKEYGINDSIIVERWPEIIKYAKENSRKRDANFFAEKLKDKNPTIEYLGEYSGSKNPVYVLCKKCGYKWHASSAYDLLHGHGCPECAMDRRIMSQRESAEGFRKKVALVNPQFELLEDYQGADIPVLCRCIVCGYEWKAKPNTIRFKKKNCPQCSAVTKKTNDVFVEELKSINCYIVPLEEYINSKTKILFRCVKCNYEWHARPHDVLGGTGCPRCAHRIRKMDQ